MLKPFNPFKCSEFPILLSLIASVMLLITIITITLLIFSSSGLSASVMIDGLYKIKDSVVNFIKSNFYKKNGGTNE